MQRVQGVRGFRDRAIEVRQDERREETKPAGVLLSDPRRELVDLARALPPFVVLPRARAKTDAGGRNRQDAGLYLKPAHEIERRLHGPLRQGTPARIVDSLLLQPCDIRRRKDMMMNVDTPVIHSVSFALIADEILRRIWTSMKQIDKIVCIDGIDDSWSPTPASRRMTCRTCERLI
jgi:hypothetical protein